MDGRPVTNPLSLGGGAPGPGPRGLGGSPDPGVTAAAALLAELDDASNTWGSPALPTVNLVPTGFLVYAAPGAPQTDVTPQPVVAWPLSTALGAIGVAATPDRRIPGLRQAAI